MSMDKAIKGGILGGLGGGAVGLAIADKCFPNADQGSTSRKVAASSVAAVTVPTCAAFGAAVGFGAGAMDND